MGKRSKPAYPEYSNGEIVIDGRTVATSKKKGNTITTTYNMSDAEKEYQKQLQSGMSTSLGNLLNISDGQKQLWTNQLNALRDKGIKAIESVYTPMETDLRNDVAARFGNMDNSVFLDKLDSITDKKATAIADLSNDLLSAQNELYTNELTNRINIITLLNNLNAALNNTMTNYTNAAIASSQSGNNYNQNAYQANSPNNMLNYKELTNSIGSMLSMGASFM